MSIDIPAYVFHQGSAPVLLSIPHMGTHIPPHLLTRMSPNAAQLADTDWHLDQLYDFARELDLSIIMATHSRYVIDLNRPPDDVSLYPGQNVTGLCPLDTFDEQPLYVKGQEPNAEEVRQRVADYWQPYHDQLQKELRRLRSIHGKAALWDAHSIRSEVPRFFKGQLPDFNLGTADGNSCQPELAKQLLAVSTSAPGYTAVLNGRFKGGYITRRYGDPTQGINAIQLELSQRTYMEEAPPFNYLPDLASLVKPYLRQLLEAVVEH
jgi:N-formylglutamate deformylase